MKGKTLKRLLCSVLVAGMLSLAVCGLSACSNSADQDAISKDLTSQLDSFKNSASQALAEELKANDSTFKALGISSDEFTKELLDGFDYSIGEITVDSKAGSATANVSLTSKTVESALTAFVNNIPTAVSNLTLSDISSEKKLNEVVGNLLLDAVKSAETGSTDLTLTYSKDGDTWVMDDLETQIYKALGLDTINLESIYSYLGVSDFSELESYISKYLS